MSDLLEKAKQCGARVYVPLTEGDENYIEFNESQLTAFASMIRQEAMEEAAKACEEIEERESKVNQFKYPELCANSDYGAACCVSAIRSLAKG